MAAHDLQLLVIAAIAVLAVIVLIARLKLNPFLALIICALAVGLAGEQDIADVLKSFAKGFGETLAGVGVVLALGAMFGRLLSDSRGADRIADVLVGKRSPRAVPWAMAFLAMLLGLPMFFETGVVMMLPIIIAVGLRLQDDPHRDPRTSPFLLAGLPAIAGLSVMHGLVPPHPGPLVAINALHADLGLTLALGVLVAVPTVILSGPLFTLWAARHATARPPENIIAAVAGNSATRQMPATSVTILTILFPVSLMLAKAGGDVVLPAGDQARSILDFVGAPIVALLLGTLLAMVTLGSMLGRDRAALSKTLAEALPPICEIILVIGAGGAFKQTLVDLGLGAAMARAGEMAQVTPLLLGWITAVLIRSATGSATVATITAAGLMTQGAATGMPLDASLLALAIGSGSLFFSNVNDAGFWLIKGMLGIDMRDMFKTWSTLETIISVAGLLLVLLLDWLL